MYEAIDKGDVKQAPEGSSANKGSVSPSETTASINAADIENSAVLLPSSVVHRSSPQVLVRQTKPTSVDTDKDTQMLVEDDKSEC